MSLIALDVEEDLDELPLIDINLNELAIIHKNGKLWKLPLVSLASLIATPARGHIDGLICSNDADADHDVITGPGECRDSTNLYTLKLESAISKMYDQPFDIGTGAGGWDGTGALPTSGVFYEHLIQRDTDGLIDKIGSLSKAAPTLPPGFSIFREFRSQVTDAAANIIPFRQTGDRVIFTTPISLVAIGAVGATTTQTIASRLPPNSVGIIESNGYHMANSGLFYAWFDTTARAIAAASATNYDLIFQNFGANGCIKDIVIPASGNINYRVSDGNVAIGINSLGWIDDRGRNAA